jgi:N-acetylmuramoyl-L-alanine amidase
MLYLPHKLYAMRTFSFLWFLTAHILTLQAYTSSNTFLAAKAEKGDGIYGMLRRYQLSENWCNFEKFLELNRLSKEASLLEGKSYLLPIELYQFNGQTIRSSVGIDNWDIALAIQRYNESMESQHLKKTRYKNDKELWVPYHLLNCTENQNQVNPHLSEELKIVPSTPRTYPIFGKEKEFTPLKSSLLNGKIFYIISGHGGPDPGAMSTRIGNELCEDEYAYDVALRLTRLLIEHGAIAYMIVRDKDDGIRSGAFLSCDNDEVVWGDKIIPLDQLKRLEQRAEIVNTLYKENKNKGHSHQQAVIIHVDSRSKRQRTDLFFYYQKQNNESYGLAQQLHQVMEDKYKKYRSNGQYHGSITPRDLYMLRKTLPSTVYVELANIKNPTDQQRIVLEKNRQYLAEWLFEGLKK